MKIVLYRPQIPQNTGNIVRTCSVSGAGLVLVRPLGFNTTNKHLKRAGLDYWEGVDVEEIDDLDMYLHKEQKSFFFFSSKAKQSFRTAPYTKDCLLIFGSETSGLPPEYFSRWEDRFFKIPMIPHSRCLNLATSAGIALFEAKRSFELSNLST